MVPTNDLRRYQNIINDLNNLGARLQVTYEDILARQS